MAKANLTAESLSEYDLAIQLHPNSVRAYLSKGTVLWDMAEQCPKSIHQQKWTQARDVFLAATETAPSKAEAHYGLGVCEFSLKHFPEAIAALQTAIRLSSDTEHYYMALAKAHWHSRQWYAFYQTGRAYCRLKGKSREAANLAARNVVE